MKNLILFGFKSCGKTHFGKRLADRLSWSFIDTDDLLVRAYEEKNSPREIYKTLGEKEFRKLESSIIRGIKPENLSIIALGGGSLLDIENLYHLRKLGKLVYLKSEFASLQKRIIAHQTPAFQDSDTSLISIFKHRTFLFESIQAPHVHVDTYDEPTILAQLHKLATNEETLFSHGIE